MNLELALKVADAVLYEGYMLYPYRPSAVKNRQRWGFGIMYPPAYDEVRAGTEKARMHCECMLVAGVDSAVHVQLRFLRLRARQVLRATEQGSEPVTAISVDGRLIESWDEGLKRTVDLKIAFTGGPPAQTLFGFPATYESEPVRDSAGRILGSVERTEREVAGALTASWQAIGNDTYKLAIEIENMSALPSGPLSRSEVLLSSMLSTQAILTLQGGEFISSLDPPPELRAAVDSCHNSGCFPVLLGAPRDRDMLLCSPIVLYDYPQVAPESAGDFYDATEMDEMLTLRVMTLTGEEKNEMVLADEHARLLLERTEATARHQLEMTHGAIRSLREVKEEHD